MEDKKGHNDQRGPTNDPFFIDGTTYVYDPVGKIYQAEPAQKSEDGNKGKREISPFIPLGVRVQRDWLAFIVSAMIGLGTFIIVASYTYYAGVEVQEMIRQYPEIKRSASAAESAAVTASSTLEFSVEHFRIEQRPYVWLTAGTATTTDFISAMSLPDLRKRGLKLILNVQVTNGGHSPAIEFESTKTEIIFDGTEEAKRRVARYVPEFLPGGRDDIPPNQSRALRSPDPFEITDDFLNDIATERKRIYVLARIRYRDVFSPRREAPYETAYCAVINASGLPISSPSDGSCSKLNWIK